MRLQRGAADQSVLVFISSSFSGAGLTGLVWNTSGLAASYCRAGAARAALTLATQTVTGAHSDGGFVEIDATNMPGVYRLDLPDAVCADGVDNVGVVLRGATGMADCVMAIELASAPVSVRRILGTLLTEGAGGRLAAAFIKFFDKATPTGTINSLPDAVAGASGGLPTTNGTKINQTVDLTAGQISIKKNVAFSNFCFPMKDTSGVLKTGLTVTVQLRKDGAGFAAATNPPSEIGATGWYTINLAQADLNANVIGFKATATGALSTDYTIVTQA